jgi:signal peptidase I
MLGRILSVLALVAIAAGLGQAYRRFEVAERSMEPALRPGDYLITSRYLDRLSAGDVVVYEHPHQPGFWMVKRAIGLPGDQITIADSALTRNGRPVDPRPTPGGGTWVVPAGSVWVIGDNRAASSGDSRSLGPISIGLVEGRAVFRYWPLRSIGPI